VNDAFMQVFGDRFTVWTDDTGINVNTADMATILGLVNAMVPGGAQPGDKEKFLKFTEEYQMLKILPPPMNKLSKPVFLQLLQASNIKIDQSIFDEMERQKVLRFDDSSNIYKVTAVGRVGDAVSTITAVWRDSPPNGEIRYWREE
jgi:hypothetical protein